jgi:hypothetical protein
MMSVAVNTLST